jgi:hypothetical protein
MKERFNFMFLALILLFSVAVMAFPPGTQMYMKAALAQQSGQPGQGLSNALVTFKYEQNVVTGVDYGGENVLTRSYSASAELYPVEGGFEGVGSGSYLEIQTSPNVNCGGTTVSTVSGPAGMIVRAQYSIANAVTGGEDESMYNDTTTEVEIVVDERNMLYEGQDEPLCGDLATDYRGFADISCHFYGVDFEAGGFYEKYDDSDPSTGATCTMNITPLGEEMRVFGTVKGLFGSEGTEGLPNSRVLLGELEEGYIRELSFSKPRFVNVTAASDDEAAKYEFRFARPPGVIPRMFVVSVLWYEGYPEMAVTNGEIEGLRFIPVYQALCIDDWPSTRCEKWARNDDGIYEVEVNFEFGSEEKIRDTHSFMTLENWASYSNEHRGVEGLQGAELETTFDDIALVMSDSAHAYYEIVRAMKYFETLDLQTTLLPLNVKSHANSAVDSNCGDAPAFYYGPLLDPRFNEAFGDLGTFAERVQATGGTIGLCGNRNGPNALFVPQTPHWHEAGHYLQYHLYKAHMIPAGEPHGGYDNTNSNDSIIEGFATFVSMLIDKYYGETADPAVNAGVNMELDVKVWDLEEDSVTGILWDFHDQGREIGLGFMANGVLTPSSEVFRTTEDTISLDAKTIINKMDEKEVKTLVGLYDAFNGIVPSRELDMIFVSHGAFADVEDRNYIHSAIEKISETGSAHSPERQVRQTSPPPVPGSYLLSETDATYAVQVKFIEPFDQYDYGYTFKMNAGEKTPFRMPPDYYPSTATFSPVSTDSEEHPAAFEINSLDYWTYIDSGPPQDGVFKQVSANEDVASSTTSEGQSQQEPQQEQPASGSNGGGCLIATAAFGSELAPQVQFLRDFRDNHVLATKSGSSFMNVFNAWYYSFSPQVADYERQQPWLQQAARVAIYPLLGILQISEKTFMIVPGEFGSLAAGMVASSLIGAVYVSPIAASIKQVRKSRLDYRLALAIVGATLSSVIASLVFVSPQGLMISSTVLVISTIVLTATFIARILNRFFR